MNSTTNRFQHKGAFKIEQSFNKHIPNYVSSLSDEETATS